MQAKRRKRNNFASYLLPPEGGIVWLKEPGLFVLPDDYLFSVLSGEREPDLLTLPVRTETRSRVAQYIQPDKGAHAQAVRRDHDLTSYMVLPAALTRELLCKGGETGGEGGDDQAENQMYNKGVRETLRALEEQSQDLLKDT